MSVDLKPCPFCGSRDVRMTRFEYVECAGCRTYGPDNDDQARAWNSAFRTEDLEHVAG